jgi:hypothetical protein
VKQRYYLGKDDDGHDYLVPVEKRDAFEEWATGDSIAGDDYPEGVISIGCSPNSVTFENPRIGQD